MILIFYPRDETAVCRKQLCEFRYRNKLIAAADALVFGVNPQDAASHADFRNRQKLGFPLLVDKGGRTARLYNAGFGPLVRRTVYLIGKDGAIRFAERGKPEPEKVLGSISAP